jgi:hypothetical protein
MFIAIHESLGSRTVRNDNNYLPVQVEHEQPCTNLPPELRKYFFIASMEAFEADYMIVTHNRNSKIIA